MTFRKVSDPIALDVRPMGGSLDRALEITARLTGP
jgi:hypothetical protein